ncbi:putative RNA-directed DNA polymerase from transposon X-element [Trichonephila clavipes]|nr:putative RNA-directed DNA polymerase from transposon X-element [Trichonephila clavipes]
MSNWLSLFLRVATALPLCICLSRVLNIFSCLSTGVIAPLFPFEATWKGDAKEGLHHQNIAEEPTYFYEPTRSFHTLDLAICSPSLLPHFNLSIEKDLYNSDPFPVILSHDSDTGGKTFPPTYSYGRADWALFTQLAVIPDVMVKTESVDIAVQEVTNVLIAAADLSIPKSSRHSFQRYKPWWNADC